MPFYENIIHHASVIRATGIVITSSNIVAHIAGMLHKKTILIHPHQFNNHPYWEKAYDNFSHYYPNTFIYKMKKNEDWHELKNLLMYSS